MYATPDICPRIFTDIEILTAGMMFRDLMNVGVAKNVETTVGPQSLFMVLDQLKNVTLAAVASHSSESLSGN